MEEPKSTPVTKYNQAVKDRENAAMEYQKQTDKKERVIALKVWQDACAVVHELENKHPSLNKFIPSRS